MEADERAKQWARLVAKNPASPQKVTSLAQTASHPRPGGQPRPENQPTSPEEPACLAQTTSQPRPGGQLRHGQRGARPGEHWPGRGQFAEKNGPFAEKCGSQAGQGDLRPGFWLTLMHKYYV